MLLAGVVVLVCGSAFMLGPESEFDSERLTQFRTLESLPGPQGRWLAAEDSSATVGQTSSSKFCENVLGGQTMFDVWFGGAQMICTENPPSAALPDYPSVHVGREEARNKAGRHPGGKFIGTAKERVRRISAPAHLA